MTIKKINPEKYETWLTLKNGKELFVRPIMETDENLVIDFFTKLSPQTLYLRFLTQRRALPESMLYQFTHINYISEFALVGLVREDGKDTIVAIARYAYSPDDNITDLAVAVRDDWQNLGIGKALLKKIVDIGKENGIFYFQGLVHHDNKLIMKILRDLGYKLKYYPESYQVDIFV